MDTNSTLIFLLTSPLSVGLITPLKKNSRVLFYSLACLVPLINLALLIHEGHSPSSHSLSKMFIFSTDRYSYLFSILVNICWLLTIIYSSAYLRSHFQERSETFHRYLSASVALVLGAGLAGNFFTLLFFYTLSIPAIYPLITIRGDELSRRAGQNYLLMTLLPTLFITIPTVALTMPFLTAFQGFTIASLGYGPIKASIILALLIIGFSKNCVAPFHLWLPKTAVAPAPVTALVHSVAAVQTATIALLKIACTVYGWDYLASLNDHFFETGWITYLCGFTAIYTAYRAWKTPDLKQRFSFSTVGQLSYIITAILVGTKQTMLGAALHIVTHSFAKLNLFFCAGIYKSVFGTVMGPDVARFIPGKRWVAWAAALSGLSITGFPLLAGYYSKDLMLIEELHRHHYSAALFLIFGSLINLVYIMPIIKAGFAKKTAHTPLSKPVPIAMVVAVLLCSALIISFSKYIFVIMRVLE